MLYVIKHRDEKWLHNLIKGQGAACVEDALLATCDASGQVTVFLKDTQREANSVLM